MLKALYIEDNIDYEYSLGQIYINNLKELGYEVDVISNIKPKGCDKYYEINFSKKLFSIKNIQAFIKMKEIIKKNNYQIVHCNEFICSFLARILSKNKKIIYSTNSFHIYKKQFILKKILYYLIEKYLSKFTRTIIVSNKEDYILAKTRYHAKNIKLIKVARNIEEQNINCEKIREQFNFSKDDYLFLNIGELNKKENQIIQLESMISIVKKYPKARLIILGKGKQKEYLENIIVKYGLSNNVQIVDNIKYRKYFLQLCKCVILTTKYYGDYTTILEAMFMKKPIIATNIKEYRDLLKQKFLFKEKDVETLKNRMLESIENNKNMEIYYNINKYKMENVQDKILKIYKY